MNKDLWNEAVKTLKSGGIVAHPTDTVYSLTCSISSQEAVEKIYRIKGKPRDTPLLLLVNSIDMLKKYVKSIHPRIETLLLYHLRPLTLIYNSSDLVPPFISTDQGTTAIRLVVQNNYCLGLIEKMECPIVSTSANIYGQKHPIVHTDISPKIKKEIDLIIPKSASDPSSDAPSIVAQFDEDGALEILRS